MSQPTPPPPHSLVPCKDVTDEEYKKVMRQNQILWTLTFLIGVPLALFQGNLLLGKTGALQILIAGCISAAVVHAVLRFFLPEAKKAGSLRIQKYPDYKIWKSSFEDKGDIKTPKLRQ